MNRHPYFEEISRLKDRIKQLEETIRIEAKEAEKSLSPKWEYEVFVSVKEKDNWYSKIPVGSEFIRINRTLVNKKQYKDHLHFFGASPINPPNELDKSVSYFVKHGVLFHDGGGYRILTDGELCSPEDWEDLKAGKLDKFLK